MSQDIATTGSRSAARRWSLKTGFAVLVLVSAVTLVAIDLTATGFLKARLLGAPEEEPAGAAQSLQVKPQETLFRAWNQPAPDLVLVLSGQQHGYLEPCGCSLPQYGGLPRRYNFIEGLKARGWPVLAVDLGDVIEPKDHVIAADRIVGRTPQTLLRYETSMKALQTMNYLAVGLGQPETEMPLLQTLGQYALNDSKPRIIAANLKDKETNFAGAIGSWVVGSATANTLKVGVTASVSPTVRQQMPAQNPALHWDDTIKAVTAALAAMKAHSPDLQVLLYQGSVAEARACASSPQFKNQFHIIMCLSQESEPFGKPVHVNDTWIVSVGHKGRYVGVVGVYRTGNPQHPFDLKYELVMLGPEYDTKPGQRSPVLDLLEDYTKEVKNGDYLAKYKQTKHPLQVEFPKAEFVGSEACAGCHREAYKIWAGHKHHQAYQGLVDAKNPSLRQFDAECIVCHTVGFTYHTGFENQQKTPHLMEVGCENCHGPGSLHAGLGKKTPPHMLELMNPYKENPNETPQQMQKRLLAIDLSCQKCHDIDNDVHWSFAKKWPAVIHHTPPKNSDAP
jgi:hypothetical protein